METIEVVSKCQHLAPSLSGNRVRCSSNATHTILFEEEKYNFCKNHYEFRVSELKRLGQIEIVEDSGSPIRSPEVTAISKVSLNNVEKSDADEAIEETRPQALSLETRPQALSLETPPPEEEEEVVPNPDGEPTIFTYYLEPAYIDFLMLFKKGDTASDHVSGEEKEEEEETEDPVSGDTASEVTFSEENQEAPAKVSASSIPPKENAYHKRILGVAAAVEMMTNKTESFKLTGLTESLALNSDLREACDDMLKEAEKKRMLEEAHLLHRKKPKASDRLFDTIIDTMCEKLLVIGSDNVHPGLGTVLQMALGRGSSPPIQPTNQPLSIEGPTELVLKKD
jgi:hypothetical protein